MSHFLYWCNILTQLASNDFGNKMSFCLEGDTRKWSASSCLGGFLCLLKLTSHPPSCLSLSPWQPFSHSALSFPPWGSSSLPQERYSVFLLLGTVRQRENPSTLCICRVNCRFPTKTLKEGCSRVLLLLSSRSSLLK